MKLLVARSIVAVLVLAAVAVEPHVANAQATLPGASSSRSTLATPTGRTNITTEATSKINAASRAPLPVTSAPAIVRPDLQWVPDRYVSVPGAPQGVLVPGHWEQRLPSGDVYVPPIVIVNPGGQQIFPAGVRPPADQRTEP
jgi:hypothetical protein